jgi:hypothetical protein
MKIWQSIKLENFSTMEPKSYHSSLENKSAQLLLPRNS